MLNLMSASEKNIQAAIAYPPLVMRILSPDDHSAFEEVHLEKQKTESATLKQLKGYRPRPASEILLPDSKDDFTYLDLDEAAQGVHFLLTGEAFGGEPPLNFLFGHGVGIYHLDVGYGPVKLFDADLVVRVVKALATQSDDALRKRFSVDTMNELEVYPGNWGDEWDIDDPLDYLMRNVSALRSYLGDVVREERGLLAYIP